MLLTIHNLPSSTRYTDVKSLLQEKCGLTELILDNLVPEGNTKKVTVGLADEGDAAILVRKINGLYINGVQLYVEDKRKKKDSDQPYRSSASLVQDAKYQESLTLQNPMGNMVPNMNQALMNYNMSGMYMPMQMMPVDQNMSYMGYSSLMAMPNAEFQTPAPGEARGFGDYQGEYGAQAGRSQEPARDVPRPFDKSRDGARQFERPSDGPRPRESGRDTQRPRDRKRRASPERSTGVFNKPSRWNDSNDFPPRKEPMPPQPWQAREAPAKRPRNFDEFQPQQEYRRNDPDWQPRVSRWDQDRRPPHAQPPPETEAAARWQPQAEPQWEPEPERPWQPEPQRVWDDPPRAMQRDNQEFDSWKGDPSGPEGDYSQPERYEPHDRHFDEGYPPAQQEPEFRGRPQRPRERRPRPGDDWNAGNDYRDNNVNPSRDGQPWNRHDEPQRPSRPNRPANRDPKPSNFNRKERHEDQRPNPPKKPLPAQQRGPADWKQIANAYPPAKKPKVNPMKPPVEPKRNYLALKTPESQPKPTKPKERKLLTNESISEYKHNRMARIINKDQTSRGQAAAFLYKSILGKSIQGKIKTVNPDIVKELRACVRSRIDVMLGEELSKNQTDIIQRYRRKFPNSTDKELYQCMKEKVLKAQKETETAKGVDEVVKTEKVDKAVPKTENADKDSKEPRIVQAADKVKPKLDRKDMTDKQIIREEKQMHKVEFSKADHYKMDPLTEKIAEEELSKLGEIFASACTNPTDNVDKTICQRINKHSLEEFLTTTRLHLAKRILDIRTGLSIRIYAAGKLPRRVFVKEYLKPYKIERLVLKQNKQGNMYVANIGNFEQYDHLCRLQNDVIDGTPVAIRSMYLVGPPPKLSRNKVIARRQQFINSQIAPIEEDCVVPVDNPELRNDDGDKLKNDADELKNDVSGELKTDETEEKIKEESAPLDRADTEDFTLDVNAESMEDFKADDFKEGEFATDEFACDNYADDPNFDNFAQDSTVHDDPEGLNIGDIKEEDLEDF